MSRTTARASTIDAGAAERLHEAQRDQPVDRLRQRAADAGDAVENQRGQQDRFAADAVRDRSVKNLADGKAEQITGNGQLHVEDRRMQASRAISGSDGRYMSIDSGPSAVRNDSNKREGERAGSQHYK